MNTDTIWNCLECFPKLCNCSKRDYINTANKIMLSLKQTIMVRDHLTEQEADEMIREAKEDLLDRIAEGDISGADEILMEYFGLEMDYIHDLMD